MGTTYELTATVRGKVGKGAARATRRDGQVPAVIYGGNQPPVAIALPSKDVFLRINGGGFFTTLATIDVGGEKIRAIPRDFQLDPVSDRPVHVDFLRVVEGSRLTIDVPVHFINEAASPGIKRGGVLNIVRHTVNLTCPADAIPNEIVADLTGLDINDSLHISHVPLPEGVRPTIARDFTVATVAAPAGVKEEIRAQAEAAGKPAEAAAEGAGEGEAKADAKPAAGAKPAAAAAKPAAAAAKPAAKK
jgi:large subunit ribosomal protein L25